MKTKKILKKLIEDLEYRKDRSSDEFKHGVNVGLDQAILLIEEKLKEIEKL